MIINSNVKYNSEILKTDLNKLLKRFSFLRRYVIGYSILGKPIYVISFGKGTNEVFYSASIHANEFITTNVLMKFIDDISTAYEKNLKLYNYNVRNIYNSTTIFICPMINPDGVDLVNGFLNTSSDPYLYAKYISSNFPSIPFPNRMESKY